ncbi:MAG: putative methyl transferase [Frankiales bacterium]|nr:putative methyl transferase [Frankiales bacterium]
MSGLRSVDITTPVRSQGLEPAAEGYTLLRDVGSSYRDGAEQTLLDIVQGSDDLGSLNEELHRRGTTWAEQYHLDRRRANVLRAFDVGRAHRVLEIGAGCGPVSRYLAEQCSLVDALEPVPARAAVAAQRLRDLPHARVFVGELADLPEEPSYDLVVVIGVLEYVAGGSADETPYVDFLEQIRRRLLPGGALILAIENKLGVKYLAGSPEDHTDRPFDSLENYPVGTPARTFDRAALTGLFRTAGFAPALFSAFPDYKMTRVVMADSLLEDPSSLGTRLPRFPSPDWVTQRDLGPNEELLWRTLASAGQAREHGNSFVVLAGLPGEADPVLWPTGREAAFFTTERRPGRATQTLVARDGGRLTMTRTALGEALDAGRITQRLESGPVHAGQPVDEVLAQGDVETVRRVLRGWIDLLRSAGEGPDGVALDLVPHNLLLADDGELVFIDDEWRSRTWTVDEVLARGLIWLSHRLATIPCPWRDRGTRRNLLAELADLAGVAVDDAWISAAIAREAELQVELLRFGRGEAGFAAEVERTRGELADLLALPLVPVRYSTMDLFLERERDRADIAALSARCAELDEHRAALQAQLGAAEEQREEIERSRAHRLAARYQAAVQRLTPEGSSRQRVYQRLGRLTGGAR